MGLLVGGKRRGTEVVSDMVRSLGVVLVFVFAFGAFFLFGRGHPDPVHVVDYAPELRAARSVAPYHVVAPVGLPPTWRATSARHTTSGTGTQRQVTFHLGFVTPRGGYASVDETNGPAQPLVHDQLGQHPRPLSTVTLGAATWQELRAAHDELALVRTSAGVTVVVHGAAGMGELAALATALR
jgi:hypothetical protein